MSELINQLRNLTPFNSEDAEVLERAASELATLTRRVEELEAELASIDAVMARRPALDKPTRRENVEHAITTAKNATDRVAELEKTVAKLPKTADGVPIVPGMHVWFYSKRSCSQWVEELKVTGWEHLPGMEPGWMFVLSVVNEHGDTDGVNLECCYSTQAAALAAKGVK